MNPVDGLDPDISVLFTAAVSVQEHAYVPYSSFRVGAAIRASSGSMYAGCNVENSAYPEGVCAEASAISAMASAGDRTIDTLVVVCDGEMLSTPCGGCRQKIREFATGSTVVHVCGPEGVRKSYSIDELLPDSFGPENLDRT